MNISIFASVGCQNLGDELIVKNEVQLLRDRYGKETQFRIFTYDTQDVFFSDERISYYEYFPIASKNPKNILRNLKNYTSFLRTLLWSDIVVIGGGGLLYETEVQSTRGPLDLWKYRMKWIRRMGKPVVFFAIGIDVETQTAKEKLKYICGYKKATVTVRDTESFFTLKELGIDSTIVDDPVFSDSSGIPPGDMLGVFDSKNISPKDIRSFDFTNKRVGVAIRQGYIGKMKNPELEKLMIEELLQVIENAGGQVVLLPHSFHFSDPQANDYDFLRGFEHGEREITHSLKETYEVYKKGTIDTCIAMRLHSIILSNLYGIDFIAVSYSKKTYQAIKKLSN